MHMPASILISGYLSKNLEKNRSLAFKTYFVPFVVFNLFWSVARILPRFLSGPGGEVVQYQLFTPGWALWFMLAMFVWKLLMVDIVKIKNIFIISLIVGVCAGLFTEYTDYLSMARIINFAPYFIAGYFISHEQLEKTRDVNKFVSVGLLFLVGLVSLYFVSQNLPLELLWSDRSYLELSSNMGFALAFKIVQYSIGFMSCFILINLIPSKSGFLLRIGKNTLPVYMLHTYLLSPLVLLMNLNFSPYLKIIVTLGASIVIVDMLSTQLVVRFYQNFINWINGKIFNAE